MRQRPPFPLGDCSGGIDTFVNEGNYAHDALNVYHDMGLVRRRPAFRSFAAAPVLHLPPGRAIVGYGASATAEPAAFDDTRVVPNAFDLGGSLYIGCSEQFDGFDWGDLVAGSMIAESGNRYLQVEYWDGTAYVTFGHILDTTTGYSLDGQTRAPCIRNGRVHWHRPTDWDTKTILTETAYFVRVTIRQTDTGALGYTSISWVLKQPGVRVFHRMPVNGIFQLGVNGGLELMACADRLAARGLEQGACIGVRQPGVADMLELNPVVRYSAGTYNDFAVPQAKKAGDAPTTTTEGLAGVVIDKGAHDNVKAPERLYLVNQPFGAVLREDVTPSAPYDDTVIQTTDVVLIEQVADALEHFLVQVTVSGGGPTLSIVRQVTKFSVASGVASITVNPPLDAVPTGTTRFCVIRPPMKVALRSQPPAIGAEADDDCVPAREYDVGALSNAVTYVYPELQSYARHPDDVFGTGGPVNIEIREWARFNLPAGRQYSSVVHPLGQQIILANGGPLLTYDGKSLSRLKVAPADNIRAEAYFTSAAFDENGLDKRLQAYQRALLTAPPAAKYVTTFNGVIVTAAGPGEPNRVRWSAPYADCDLWPLGNEQILRDPFGGPITGMVPYYDRLVVFTAKTVFEGVLGTDGRFNFRPVTNSTGFRSHHTTCKVAMGPQDVLIGPTIDGLIMYSGGEPTYLIDRWDRVIGDGIDVSDLEKSSACALQQQGYYFLALRRRSSSALRSTILVYDYINKRSWLWSCPYGVNRLEVLSLPNGKETLVIGTEDGFLMTLVDAMKDDGVEDIEGRVRTVNFNLAGGRRVSFARTNITMNDLGGGSNVTVRTYLDRSDRYHSSASIPFDAGQAKYGTAVFGLSKYADEKDKTMPVNVPSGTRARSLSVEVISTDRWELRTLEAEVDLLTAGKR